MSSQIFTTKKMSQKKDGLRKKWTLGIIAAATFTLGAGFMIISTRHNEDDAKTSETSTAVEQALPKYANTSKDQRKSVEEARIRDHILDQKANATTQSVPTKIAKSNKREVKTVGKTAKHKSHKLVSARKHAPHHKLTKKSHHTKHKLAAHKIKKGKKHSNYKTSNRHKKNKHLASKS